MTLVVGHPPRREDTGALHLAASLARSSGHDLRVVSVVAPAWPTPLPSGPDREFSTWSRDLGAQALQRADATLAALCPDVSASTVVRSGSSVAAELIAEAASVDAAMIVVGSATDGAWGRAVVGSTADRLLHSSTLPVALAPRGHGAPADTVVGRVTCAFRGDEASVDVVRRAGAICTEIGADLRVVTFAVRGRTMYPPEVLGEQDVLDAYVEQTTAAQERAVAALDPRPPHVTTSVATGDSWGEALAAVDWRADDVLVVGSSSAGLLSRLFLGSRASKILRHSPVPVVTVP